MKDGDQRQQEGVLALFRWAYMARRYQQPHGKAEMRVPGLRREIKGQFCRAVSGDYGAGTLILSQASVGERGGNKMTR